jgi:terminase, large subunit
VTTYLQTLQRLWQQTVALWEPPRKLTLSQWADEYFYLSPESSSEPGKWHTLPTQRAILDAFTQSEIEDITVKKSSRVGYTKVLDIIIGYCIHQDPCSVLVVQPTGEDAEGYSKDEIAPMIRDTPVLSGLVADDKSRSSGNTILKKKYPGGILNLIGAHSPRGFRRLTTRVVLFDEVDGYPALAGKEGDQIQLGRRRAQDFWNRKIVKGSSPTIEGSSKIVASFMDSRRGYCMVPCPHCNELHVRKFFEDQSVRIGVKALPVAYLKWPEDEPGKAEWVCPNCAALIGYEHHRWQIDRCEWHGEGWRYRLGRFEFDEGFTGRIGFEWWCAYSMSPNTTPSHLAHEFLDAKRSPETLQTFYNTILGETWKEHTSGLDANTLQDSAREGHGLGEMPEWVALLTAGVDTQADRWSVQIFGWGWNDDTLSVAVVDRYRLPGDPNDDETLAELEEQLDRSYTHPCGAALKPKISAIDSGGHHTQRVVAMCRANKPRGWIAVKGLSRSGSTILRGKPTKVDFKVNGKVQRRSGEVWLVAPDTAKSWINRRLHSTDNRRSPVHLARDMAPDYFRELVSEYYDAKLRRWVNPTKRRNEALDEFVYGLAAAHHPKIRIDTLKASQFEAMLNVLKRVSGAVVPQQLGLPLPEVAPAPAATSPPVVAPAPARSGWIDESFTENWL